MGQKSFHQTNAQIRVKYPPLHINQQPVHDSQARFKVLACGRRFGKTDLAKREMLECALQPGGGRVWYIAPSYQISYQAWRDIIRLAEPLIAVKREMEKFVVFKNGGEIAFKTAGSDEKMRGAGLNLAVLDEAAFIPDPFFNEVIRPMLADRKGSALLCSTPNGINGFYDMYTFGLPENRLLYPEWESFHYTSYDNPFIDPKEIDAAKLTTSDLQFRQEYMAEFLDFSGTVFHNLRDVCVLAPNRVAQDNHAYVAGIDWSAGGDDFSVIVVFDATVHEMVYYNRIRETDFASQYAMIAAVQEFYQCQTLLAEENTIGAPAIEELSRMGIRIMPFVTSQASKHQLVQEMIHNIETHSIKLLNDPILINEFSSYTAKRSKNGQYSYSASRGHDDIVMAIMLANHLLGQPTSLFSHVKSFATSAHRPMAAGMPLYGDRNMSGIFTLSRKHGK